MQRFIIISMILIVLAVAVSSSAFDINLEIKPDKLNLKSKGNWVTAFISPPQGCEAEDIIIETIAIIGIVRKDNKILEVRIPADPSHFEIRDFTRDSVRDLIAKFPRRSLQKAISSPGIIAITIEGFCGQQYFTGSDTIRAMKRYTEVVPVQLPSSIPLKDLQIQSPCMTTDLNSKGVVTLSGIPENPFLVIASYNGIPVALSFFDPASQSNTISCHDTAVSLSMFNSLIFALPANLIHEALTLVSDTPEVKALGEQLCVEISNNPETLAMPPEDFSDPLSQLLHDAAQAVNDKMSASATTINHNEGVGGGGS